MIDYEKITPELLERIEMLETLEEDLRWRMNQICNKLSMEEAKPELRYKIGDTVYGVYPNNEITEFRVLDIDLRTSKMYACADDNNNHYYWAENDLYPTREALIRAHVEYWKSMLEPEEPEEPEECVHEKGMVSRHTCIEWQCKKCGEFYR